MMRRIVATFFIGLALCTNAHSEEWNFVKDISCSTILFFNKEAETTFSVQPGGLCIGKTAEEELEKKGETHLDKDADDYHVHWKVRCISQWPFGSGADYKVRVMMKLGVCPSK